MVGAELASGDHCAESFGGEWFGKKAAGEHGRRFTGWCTEGGTRWSVFSGGTPVLVMKSADVRKGDYLSLVR